MKAVLSFVCFTFFTLTAQSQFLSVPKLIDAWSIHGIDQTIVSETTYDDLRLNINPARLVNLLSELHTKIDPSSNRRLHIRLLMYELLSRKNLALPPKQNEDAELILAIKQANQLGDLQLLSELYSLCADTQPYPDQPNLERSLLYGFKAVELQQRIGEDYFPRIYLRYLNLSISLYTAREYRQSLNVGLRGLKIMQEKRMYSVDRYMQYDYVASCYKQLNMPDSMLYYYTKAKNDYPQFIATPDHVKEIWGGVIDGGIASALFMQGKYEEAILLLEKNIVSSTYYAQWSDAALAQNNLANIYFKQGKNIQAISGWRNALTWASLDRNYQSMLLASQSLADAFSKMHQYDSCSTYLQLSIQYKDSLNKQSTASLLSMAKAQASFDDLQFSLRESEVKLSREKYIRNSILTGIVLLSVISLLIYNRKRLAEKLKVQQLEQENREAMFAVQQANREIDTFRKSIIEKNELIENLQQQQAQPDEPLREELQGYVFITEEEWERFRTAFIKTKPDFFQKLSQQLNGSSSGEEKLAALICLGLNNYQAANTLGISKESVSRSKRRLRQRLNLDSDADLDAYITAL